MTVVLWILQALLALLFAANGIRKLTQSAEALGKTAPALRAIPMGLVRFIGTAELLGAIGLIVPSAIRIAPVLTPSAAAGLALLMVCATTFHVARKEYAHSGVTAVIMVLTVFVLYGRLALAPITG